MKDASRLVFSGWWLMVSMQSPCSVPIHRVAVAVTSPLAKALPATLHTACECIVRRVPFQWRFRHLKNSFQLKSVTATSCVQHAGRYHSD